ncbi:hypothetical protein [Chryseobacterium shigense]|uniref:YD repeat-containing protein n=1 Tax=Chryseobacterium shigense TaxID=297244 RepID=A0A841N5U4_9FLAO|nr:hypothetical protein [Chryseobacterium shigense]MBB6372466.1 hypothetical protein [Chryseobacterium shigense]
MDKFHGKVKSVKEYISGIILRESLYLPEGEISEIKLYKKGILSSIEKRYEKDGMQVREVHRLGENTPEMILLHYSDSSGNRNRTEYYDLEHNLLEKKEIGKTSIEYNSTGKRIRFSKDEVILFQKQFNGNNQAVEEISFSDHGDTIYTVKYFYHENTITRKSFDAEKRLVKLRYMILDEKSRILQSFKFSRYEAGNDSIDHPETYNTERATRITVKDLKKIDHNDLPESSVFPLDNTFAHIDDIKKFLSEFRYDMDGKELSGYPPVDFFDEFTDVQYDHAGREISNEQYMYWPYFNEKELTRVKSSASQYNDEGLLIAHSYYETEKNHDFGGSYRYAYEFDSENRIIKKITTGDSKSVTNISYENGNRIEIQENEHGQKFTHIFDSNGNLIYYEDASEKGNRKWFRSYEITYYG